MGQSTKPRRETIRVNISVPLGIRSKMIEATRSKKINWSAIASQAFLEYIEKEKNGTKKEKHGTKNTR